MRPTHAKGAARHARPDVGRHALCAVPATVRLEQEPHTGPGRGLRFGAREPGALFLVGAPGHHERLSHGGELIAGYIAPAACPARNFSALVKEPGPVAFWTSNTARASASLTSATLALSAGSSSSLRPPISPAHLLAVSPAVPPRADSRRGDSIAARRRAGQAGFAVRAVHAERSARHLAGLKLAGRLEPEAEAVVAPCWEQRDGLSRALRAQAAAVKFPQNALKLLLGIHGTPSLVSTWFDNLSDVPGAQNAVVIWTSFR